MKEGEESFLEVLKPLGKWLSYPWVLAWEPRSWARWGNHRGWVLPGLQAAPSAAHTSVPAWLGPRTSPEAHKPEALAAREGEPASVWQIREDPRSSYQCRSQEEFVRGHPTSASVSAQSGRPFISMCDKLLPANRSFKRSQTVSISLEGQQGTSWK